MFEFFFVNFDVRFLDSVLFAGYVKIIHFIFYFIANRTNICLEFPVIEKTKFLVNFLPDTVQINRISLLFQVLFVGLKQFFVKVRRYFQFLKLGCSQLELSLDSLGLFLVSHNLLFKRIYCLCVGFDIKVLKTLDSL